MAQGESGRKNAKLPGALMKAKLLLRAAYLGTYYAAIDQKCPKLYLTLIGGGVFGNNIKDIFDIIVDTHRRIGLNKKYNSCIKEVHLPLFTVPYCVDAVVEEMKKARFPFKLIKHTKKGPVVVDSYLPPEKTKEEKA